MILSAEAPFSAAEVTNPAVLDITLATAHQAVGAVLLAFTVALALWTHARSLESS